MISSLVLDRLQRKHRSVVAQRRDTVGLGSVTRFVHSFKIKPVPVIIAAGLKISGDKRIAHVVLSVGYGFGIIPARGPK